MTASAMHHSNQLASLLGLNAVGWVLWVSGGEIWPFGCAPTAKGAATGLCLLVQRHRSMTAVAGAQWLLQITGCEIISVAPNGLCLQRTVCGAAAVSCSPFDDNTTAQPRLRPLPAAPEWLKRWLGPDAECGCCEEDANNDTYHSLTTDC